MCATGGKPGLYFLPFFSGTAGVSSRKATTPTKAAPQPAPAEQAASAVPVAREDTVQPKAEPKKESQPKPKPKPEPKPDEVALAQKKQPKKP